MAKARLRHSFMQTEEPLVGDKATTVKGLVVAFNSGTQVDGPLMKCMGTEPQSVFN